MAGTVSSADRLGPLGTEGPETSRAGVLVNLLRLRWFIRLRWLFVGAALAVLAVEHLVFPATRRPAALLNVVFAVAAINVVWLVISRLLRRRLDDPAAFDASTIHRAQLFAHGQIAIDLLLLTALLHFSGGVESPMAVFYIFHVAIGALLLPAWQAALECAWAVLLYAALAAGEWSGVLAHHSFLPQLAPTRLYNEPVYVVPVVLIELLAVFATLYFTLRIARLLDDRREELLRANAALERSRRSIEDLQHRRARFMQTAAHQLKSPLAMGQTLANLIREGLVTERPDVLATCEKIIRRCHEGITQLSELLTLARVQEADPARQREAQADVVQIVTQLCARFRPLAERKQVELTCWTPPRDDLYVRVGPDDLSDCIGNLIDNAIKYTPGPGRVRVAVTVKLADDVPVSVGVHVSDSGMGFDPALLHAEDHRLGEQPVFEAFRRGPNVMAAGIPGSGLGLSIVREVVEQAGGRIWVVSRPGAGTSFTLTLPIGGESGRPPIRDTRATEVVLEGVSPTKP